MLVNKTETAPGITADHRASFFRQSGWLMIANVAGGVLMYAVHLLNQKLPRGDYGSFVTFLAVVMLLPTIPLQMVLAQQTAKALANHAEHELSGVIRLIGGLTTLVWLVGAILVLILQQQVLDFWHMTDPVGLWVTLPVVLLSLWLPLVWGVLQGQQNFLWLGWSMLSNGIGRLAIATLAVVAFAGGAAGMMAGVLLGLVLAVAIGAWHTRSLWLAKPLPFDWRSVLGQILPLAFAFLGFQILFTADTICVKHYFPKTEVDFYGSAGTMSRALTWLVMPLASVMFPRIAHSAAKGQKTNLMSLVLIGTAVLSIVGAVAVSILGPFIIRHIYDESYVPVASSILPWYATAMVPLSLANVLLNDLLARPASKLPLAIAVLLAAGAYIYGLTQYHETLTEVLQVMTAFNTVLLLVSVGFWQIAKAKADLEHKPVEAVKF